MKIKKIKIKSKEDFFRDAHIAAREIDAGLPVTQPGGDFFESLEAVRTLLTEKRLAIWRLVRDRHPNSIFELARLADRDFKSVHRDITVLVAVGLVALKPGKGAKGKTQVPKSLADSLSVEVA
jgi:predicted transcriptional regulator